jgi:MFS family permease
MTTGITHRLINLRTFDALRYRNFRFLIFSSLASSAGMNMLMVAQGWLVLELTDSPLSLGLVWATRLAPSLFLGVAAGTVADRVDRAKLLMASFIVRGICAIALGLLVTFELVQVWHIFFIAFTNGVAMVFNLPTQQSLAMDIVRSEGTMNAISLNTMGMRVVGIFGGATAGLVIEFFGLAWPFYIMALSCVAGIILLNRIGRVERAGIKEGQSAWGTYLEGMRLVATSQIVLVILLVTLVGEILGFSYMVMLPVFARDILEVGPLGLGAFSTATSVGGLLAGLSLASLGNFPHKGRLMLGIFLSFGIFLVLFSQSPWFPVSLVLLTAIGAMAAGLDAMGHTILMLNVSGQQRGRAMGVWMMGIGFGPVGSITIGAVASLLGAPAAVTINGLLIVSTSAVLFLFVPRLRRL